MRREIKIDDIKELRSKLLKQTVHASTAILERFAELQEERASRLTTAKTRLAAELGEDHPRVVALGLAASSADKLKQSIHATAVRQARLPKIKPDEWLVFGRVLDAAGNPIPDLRVRVFDKDIWNCDDLLGVAKTDEYGDFTVVYTKDSFAHWGDKLPDLYVRVEDAEDKLLYSSRDNIHYEAGKAEYFEIILSDFETSRKESHRR